MSESGSSEVPAKRGGRRLWRVGTVIALAAAVGFAVFGSRFRDGREDRGGNESEGDAERVPVVSPEGLVVVDSEFERRYPDPNGKPVDDLRMLGDLLGRAWLLVKNHDALPLADNRDFTLFLSGRNSHRVAWIRPGHPSVSKAGEILDRWGSPVFFHRESSLRTTLRSAGPDRTMWNDDDVIWLDGDE